MPIKKKTTAKKKAVNRRTVGKKKTVKKTMGKKKVARKTVRKKKTVNTAATGKKATKKTAAPQKTTRKMRGKKKPATATLPAARTQSGTKRRITPYQAKKGEEYMNPAQLEHFKQILLAWKRDLMKEVEITVHHMKEDASNFADPTDRATQETEFGFELRTRDRERKLLRKINTTLLRIEDGSYGYCEESGEEIGIRRLEARPVATLSLEAQQRRELKKKQFRDQEDGDR